MKNAAGAYDGSSVPATKASMMPFLVSGILWVHAEAMRARAPARRAKRMILLEFFI
jgi:hypothetical protein